MVWWEVCLVCRGRKCVLCCGVCTACGGKCCVICMFLSVVCRLGVV